MKLVRPPHFVQRNDNHRAVWFLQYPARSSLRGGISVEARIKVPVGSTIAGGGDLLAGSQGCVYLGSALSPLACLPPAGRCLLPPSVAAVEEALAVPPTVSCSGQEKPIAAVHVVLCISYRTVHRKTRKEKAVFPTVVSYRTECESSSFLPSSHMGESTESNDSHQTISFLIIIIIITSIYRAVCVRHCAKHLTAWVTACRLSKGLRKQKLLFYR